MWGSGYFSDNVEVKRLIKSMVLRVSGLKEEIIRKISLLPSGMESVSFPEVWEFFEYDCCAVAVDSDERATVSSRKATTLPRFLTGRGIKFFK
jgi:hypothetical protein